MSDVRTYHEPVMPDEVLEGLAVRAGGTYVDCTLGDAGHTTLILDAAENTRVLGLDADPEAVAVANGKLAGRNAVVANANFRDLSEVAHANGFVPADGVLFDLGLSSRQLDAEDRGFSFRRPGPLDMRFTPDEGETAADIVNHASEQELADIIYRLGEEPRSRRIARAIVAARPIRDAEQLAEIVRRSSGYRRGRTHPATRTFQALRMAVNDELGSLRAGLNQAVDVLAPGGRLVTIAYHSLEDREVKRFMAGSGVRSLHKKVLRPSAQEVQRNPRSRSARMRVAERTAQEQG